MYYFFFHELQLITVLLLIHHSYMSLNIKFISPENVCGIFYFLSIEGWERFGKALGKVVWANLEGSKSKILTPQAKPW